MAHFQKSLLQLPLPASFYALDEIFRAALKKPPGQTRWTAIESIVARSKINTHRIRVSRRRSISGEEPRRDSCAARGIAAAFLLLHPNFITSPHLAARLRIATRFSFSRNRGRRSKRANARPAWSTYLERLNIYKQWPNGSLADRNGSDTLLPWLALI